MYTEQCIICDSPLGQDSRDLDYPFCHTCRKCTKCGNDLRPKECKLCIDKLIESSEENEIPLDYKSIIVTCPRCASTPKDDPIMTIRASEYDRLNLCRLAIDIDPNLSLKTNMENSRIAVNKLFHERSLEEKYAFLDNLQEICGSINFTIMQDHKQRRESIVERDRKLYDKAKKEREKIIEHPKPVRAPRNEDEIEAFAKRWHFSDMKEASKQFTLYKNSIKQYMSFKIPESEAIKAAEEALEAGMKVRGVIKNGTE